MSNTEWSHRDRECFIKGIDAMAEMAIYIVKTEKRHVLFFPKSRFDTCIEDIKYCKGLLKAFTKFTGEVL